MEHKIENVIHGYNGDSWSSCGRKIQLLGLHHFNGGIWHGADPVEGIKACSILGKTSLLCSFHSEYNGLQAVAVFLWFILWVWTSMHYEQSRFRLQYQGQSMEHRLYSRLNLQETLDGWRKGRSAAYLEVLIYRHIWRERMARCGWLYMRRRRIGLAPSLCCYGGTTDRLEM